MVTSYVDVDRAHVLAYEHEGLGAGGRYLCVGAVLHCAPARRHAQGALPAVPRHGQVYTRFIPSDRERIYCRQQARFSSSCGVVVLPRCEDDGMAMARPYKFSNQRLRDLALEFTPLKKSLYEAVIRMQKKGHLPIITKQPRANM
jgi:cinnamoyl-CoA reductase